MNILTLCLCVVVPLMSSGFPRLTLMASAVECPSDWRQFGSQCYLFIAEKKTWAQAETYCISQGGHLTSVHSEAEHCFLQTLTTSYSWIGGYEGGEEGLWFWSDGTRFVYQNWADGEPSRLRGQHCLAMNWHGRWDDGWVRQEQPFICAKSLISPK